MLGFNRRWALCLPLLTLLHTSAFAQETAKPFPFEEGDRVLLLGSTFIEREGRYGCIEGAITLSPSLPPLQFRNLGWSGDSVFGHARSYFGPPAEGLERLGKQLEALTPTVVMVSYGTGTALEGPQAIPEFIAGYKKLLDLIAEKAKKPRLVLIVPPPFENIGPPFPDLSAANTHLATIAEETRKLATERNAHFVDLPALLSSGPGRSAAPLTDNGVHYGEAGYQRLADQLCVALGIEDARRAPPELRERIVEKNTLLFRRWRPANETYLNGFRKHEQGQNAAELVEFDPLVEKAEQEIAALSKSLATRP